MLNNYYFSKELHIIQYYCSCYIIPIDGSIRPQMTFQKISLVSPWIHHHSPSQENSCVLLPVPFHTANTRGRTEKAFNRLLWSNIMMIHVYYHLLLCEREGHVEVNLLTMRIEWCNLLAGWKMHSSFLFRGCLLTISDINFFDIGGALLIFG